VKLLVIAYFDANISVHEVFHLDH